MQCLLFNSNDKINFKVQMIKGLIHMLWVNYMSGTPKVTENDVIHFILNTSLSLFTQFDTVENGTRQDGQIKAIFRIKGQAKMAKLRQCLASTTLRSPSMRLRVSMTTKYQFSFPYLLSTRALQSWLLVRHKLSIR